MAIIRIPSNPKRVGKVGAESYYVRNGEQVVRQRLNASNYGESASRSYGQQSRRARWGNLVNVYKACAAWLPKAFEFRPRKRSDYNMFMSYNVELSGVFMAKSECEAGGAVLSSYVVSQGSLRSLIQQKVTLADAPELNAMSTGLKFTAPWNNEWNNGTFSKQLIADNPVYLKDGDNIAFVEFLNEEDEYGIPRLQSWYNEFTLDTSSTDDGDVSNLLGNSQLGANNNIVWTPNNAFELQKKPTAGVVILTRRQRGGLKVSQQRVVMFDESLMQSHATDSYQEYAIRSYGLSTEVPLEPGTQS